MQKIFSKILVLVSVLFCMSFFAGCGGKVEKNEEEASAQITDIVPEVKESNKDVTAIPVSYAVENRLSVDYKSMTDYFNPDFEPVTFESKPYGSGTKKNLADGSDDSKKTESIIPGLRNLDEYKTKYSTARPEPFEGGGNEEIELENEISNADNKSFYVEYWGPQGQISAENKNPTFYVSFSQPVHRLEALSKPSNKSTELSIGPQLKGVYRWYGSKMLAFEASEPADPSQIYTISVNSNLKALSGASLTGQNSFKTTAAKVTLERFMAGYLGNGDYDSGWGTGVLPPQDKCFYIRLNYPVKKEYVEDNLIVKCNGKNRTFTVEPDYDKSHFEWGLQLSCDETKKKTNSFVVTIDGSLPFGTSVQVTMHDKTESYNTLGPFYVYSVDQATKPSRTGKENPVSIDFNLPVDESTVADNISFDFDFKLTKNNYSVNGTTITFYNLPIKKNETHTIKIGSGLKDKFGQSIDYKVYKYGRPTNQKAYSYDFVVSPLPAYTRFLDYGQTIMEAQFPHKILFEYQNVLSGGKYAVSRTTNPLSSSFDDSFISSYGKAVEPGTEDQRHFVEIPLDPYLKNGYGFVKFQADIPRRYWDRWDERWETTNDTNAMTIQVTDLGVTSRIGVNKAVVFVSSLSTGKPVEGATVDLYTKIGPKQDDIDSTPFASGVTDKKGLVVISFTEEQLNKLKQDMIYLDYSAPIVKVSKGDDMVMYKPNSHYSYGRGIERSNYNFAITPKQRTFMFVDRGLYRPGETVTFRGVDRSQILGQLIVQQGDYSVEIWEASWDGTKIGETIKGTLSESGGFWGSVKLPEDLNPGSYTIRYRRADSKDKWDYESIYFTVAEFERLKFEASAEIPSITYYGGDNVNANISASYLAGGKLSGASFRAHWFSQPVIFAPENPEVQGYSFGPAIEYSSRNNYSDEDGKLTNDGTASVMCSTATISNGVPQRYRLSADITDISNQSINTGASVMVHPAQYYIGLKANKNGFAEKGKALEISYLLVNTDGTELTGNIGQKVKNVEYKLSHTEWKYVNEQSVSSSIYTRYVNEEVEDSKGKLTMNSATGSFTLTPTAAGWHTLVVTGYDSKNNLVKTEIGFYVTGAGGYWYGDSESITLTTSQNMYNPGDKAQILMQSPVPAGDYLITVEREGIFTQEIKHFDSAASVIEIPVSNNYVPVVYVSVSTYSVRNGAPTHEYGEVDLDKPKGYYGAVPLFVNPQVKAFSIDIQCDKPTYRPGDDVEITLTATKGGIPFENSELTLMAVDRGVLDLINYHVEDPIHYFYSTYNYPLCVYGGDSRALLMDPVTYSVKNLAGGDAAEDEEKEEKRKDFRPTAVFEPVLITDKNGKAVCKFKMPDNLTTYRITAFGVNNDLFALQEEEVKVQNPVNVSVVKPRKLRERDTAEVGVLITNLDKDGHEITVKLDVSGATKVNSDTGDGMSVVPGTASIDGPAEHKVYVASGDSSVVYFDLAAEKEGTVALNFHIKSDVLNEGIEEFIKIEKTFVYETVALMGSLNSNETKGSELIKIPGFAKEGRGDLSITLDATRLGLLGNGVNYVFDYPYGCLEQQTSRILPLVAFDDYIDVFGLNNKVVNPKTVVTNYMKDIAKSQLSSGGFPYWPAGWHDNFYVSLRILNIYQLALDRGYTKADMAINADSLMDYIKNNINRAYTDSMKAQACYYLARAGRTNLNYMLSNLYDDLENQSLSSIAYIGLAYQEKGESDNAQVCEELLKQYLVPSNRTVSITEKVSNHGNSVWENQSELMSVILKFLVIRNPNDEMVDRLINTLMLEQKHGYWQNTVTTAQVLESIYTYIKERKLNDTDHRSVAILEGKELVSESFKGASAKPKTLKLPFEDAILASLPRDTSLNLGFSKKGDGYLFYNVAMTYALPDEMQAARDEGIKVTYEIRDFDSDELLNPVTAATNELRLESGKLYKAKITLESTKNREYVALRAPIPSGAEILDSTFVTTGEAAEIETSSSSYWGHWLSNKFIHDNEIQFFWDYFSTGSTTVTFTFRAARRGVYPVPPVQAECMYEPEVFGRDCGYLAEIK